MTKNIINSESLICPTLVAIMKKMIFLMPSISVTVSTVVRTNFANKNRERALLLLLAQRVLLIT